MAGKRSIVGDVPANVQLREGSTALLNTHVQVRGVRGADQRDRGAQPGHERAPVPAQLGQSLDRIQLRNGNKPHI